MALNEDFNSDIKELLEVKKKLFYTLDELGNLHRKIYKYVKIKSKDRTSLYNIYERFTELIEEL